MSVLCKNIKEVALQGRNEREVMARKEKSPLKSFIAGSFSGTCSCLLFQPLDLIKTRIQAPAIYGSNGMISTIFTVVRTDSITGLWRGVTPTISRTVPGVGIYFSSLHVLKSFIFPSQEPKAWQNVLLGFTARSFAGVSLLPITVVKTRYESGIFNYKGVTSALVSIWKAEGTRGLFSGCAATVARDAPFSGLYLMFYNVAKEQCRKGFGQSELRSNIHFLCGMSAGMMASIITQPADVIKTQLQLYPFRYKNTLDCMVVVVRNNGPSGLFRGTLPRCLRRTLMASMTWTVYESVMQHLGLKIERPYGFKHILCQYKKGFQIAESSVKQIMRKIVPSDEDRGKPNKFLKLCGQFQQQ